MRARLAAASRRRIDLATRLGVIEARVREVSLDLNEKKSDIARLAKQRDALTNETISVAHSVAACQFDIAGKESMYESLFRDHEALCIEYHRIHQETLAERRALDAAVEHANSRIMALERRRPTAKKLAADILRYAERAPPEAPSAVLLEKVARDILATFD